MRGTGSQEMAQACHGQGYGGYDDRGGELWGALRSRKMVEKQAAGTRQRSRRWMILST